MLSFLALPLFLMVHNPIDFGSIGACPQYATLLSCVVTDYVETLEAHNNLKLVNKTGVFGQKIEKIGLQFESYDHYYLSDARTMMVGLIDSVIDALNKSNRLRPHLPCGGFSPANIEIRVNFVDRCKYAYPGFDEIKNMSYIDGVISYSVGNPRSFGHLLRYREEGLQLARSITPPLVKFIPPKCRDPRWVLD